MKKTVFDDTGLKEYKRKRNFRETAEPPPRLKKAAAKKLLFVIQKHDATRLHYDFRLEMEGVLKSWAVPKGPPVIRGDKRLAVEVEDHPFDYARFEGTIPEGNYGAGTVMVWDIGTYTALADDPLQALRDGKLHLILEGKKLKGEWALVRMKPRPGEDKPTWLLFKSGKDAKPLSAKKDDESVLTGRSMAQIASENKAQWQSDRAASNKKQVEPRIAAAIARREKAKLKTSVPPQNLPSGDIRFIEPMKCRLMEHAASGTNWIYEIKFDGFRTLALKDGKKVELFSRNRKNLNHRFPEIVAAVRALPCNSAIIDGEVVALDEQGRSSFQLLQMSDMPGQKRAPICYYAFDCPNLDGKNLQELPLHRRKEILQSIIRKEDEPIRFSANIHGDPKKVLAQVQKLGLEGFIAKEIHSKYEPGRRSPCWQKIKISNEQEFVIGGYTEPKGSRDYFGAILVGYYEKDAKNKNTPRLIFVSKVGSGFNQELLSSIHKRFQKLKQEECPFANLPEKAGFGGRGLTAAEMRRCTWIDPQLVCEIRFNEWTRDNHLRQPVFLGLREDKSANEVIKEEPND